MFRNALKPWRFALVITLVALLAFGTTVGLFGASVSPDVWPGNDPSVADFVDEYDPDCENVIKAKYDPDDSELVDGTFTDGDFSVDIVFGDEDEGEYHSVSFSNASHKVLGVFVKGGPDGGNMYYYPDGVYADSDLVAPDGKGISHVSFYYCDDEMPEYGSLRVTKAVYGEDLPSPLPVFDITVTGPGGYIDNRTIAAGGTYLLEGLDPGTYVVTEATLGSEWTIEYEVKVGAIDDGDDNEVEVKVGTESHVLVKNTYAEIVIEAFGSLTVHKEVFGDTSSMTLPDFKITVTGPEGFEETENIADGDFFTWEKLVPGIYTVKEDTSGFSAEWTVEYEIMSGKVTDGKVGEVEVFIDTESEVRVENTYKEEVVDVFGSLTVYKEVHGNTTGMSLPDFKITVTGPNFEKTVTIADGKSFTWLNLVPGIYTVTEDTSGFSSKWSVKYEVVVGVVAEGKMGEVRVIGDRESKVIVKNTYDEIEIEAFGSLTVHKVVKGADKLDKMPEFLFTVTGPGFTSTRAIKAGESYTWIGLEPGTYKVTEAKLGSGWTVKGEGNIKVEDDLESEVTVTNTYSDLPYTGGDPVTMILSGLMLAGLGTVIRRRKQ